MAFFSGVMAGTGLIRATHFPNVAIIAPTKLDLYCSQFNLVRTQLNFKGLKQTFISYLESIGIKKTEDLQAKLNQAVTNPTQKIPQTAGNDQLKGPMLLPFLIDYMWLLIIEPIPKNLIISHTKMFDPDKEGGPTEPMMSHTKFGFKHLGVVFRGDTRSFQQFASKGFTARFAEPPGDPFHVPETYGTVAAEGMAYDKSAKDFANQTGVCVARNIVGSMKFIGNAEKNLTKGYMYAAKFNDGVDTERMQLDKQLTHGKTVLWRAGEKAAWAIPKWRFIASCQFEVSKPYTDENRTFGYRRLTPWTFHWSGVSELKTYVEKSTAKIPVGKWCDFGTLDDWAAEN